MYAVVNKMATNKLMKGVTLKYKADYILIHRWLQADEAVRLVNVYLTENS